MPPTIRNLPRLVILAALSFAVALSYPLANDADLDGRIDRLETELRRAGTDAQRSGIASRLADLQILRARSRFESGANLDAIAGYEEALRHVPEHPVALLELGWLELRVGRIDAATMRAETGLFIASRASDTEVRARFLQLRGEIRYADNRLRDALSDLEEALSMREEDERLASRVAKVRRDLSAESGYSRADSQHFVLSYDGERDETIGRAVLDTLERAWNELTGELDSYPSDPITVILHTREAFEETTGSDRRVAGVFDGKIRMPAGGLDAVGPSVERVLRHELAHALLHAKGTAVLPRWLHEGVAQLMEPRSPAEAHRIAARQSTPALEPFSYPKSLSFCDYLRSEYSLSRLVWLAELLARRTPENDAFRKALGTRKERIVEEWGLWLNREN